eukprot:14091336-Alexandrium_andersonii.AAC.1
MRADLLEFVTACGFKQWSNVTNPCFCCNSRRDDLYNFPASIATASWQQKDAKDYDKRVRANMLERRVNNSGTLLRLKDALRANEELGGFVLPLPFGELNLPAGVRLVELGDVTDIHSLAELETPATLFFFNAKGDFGLNFVCPLFA